jgi:uncharacterized membrane protein
LHLDLIALDFESAELAEAAVEALRDLAGEDALALKDVAVVVKDVDGGVELHQRSMTATGEALVGGGTIGLLLGLAFAVPVAGALIGIAGGGAASLLDRGIEDDRMRRFGAELAPGRAALFALLGKADWPVVRARLGAYDGEIVISEVAPEVLAVLEP